MATATATRTRGVPAPPTAQRRDMFAALLHMPHAAVSDETVFTWLSSLPIPDEFDQPRNRRLAMQAQAGDVDARDELLLNHLRMIYVVACKYDRRGVDLWDLLQEGYFGFAHAIAKYDVAENTNFSTYAVWWIRQSISRAVGQQRSAIRLPEHAAQTADRVMRLGQGALLSVEEIATELDISVAFIRELHASRRLVSLNITNDRGNGHPFDDGDEYGDSIADERANTEQTAIEHASTHDLHLALDGVLVPRERRVIAMRFGLAPAERCYSLEEIGKVLHISRERVRQLEMGALAKLRTALSREQWQELLPSA